MRSPTPLTERDQRVIAAATSYVATVFLGRGNYARVDGETLAEVRVLGLMLVRLHKRPALVYAVAGEEQAHVENIEVPNGK